LRLTQVATFSDFFRLAAAAGRFQFFLFLRLAAAASRPKPPLATELEATVASVVLVDSCLPQVGGKKKKIFLQEFRRDPVARGSSAIAPSPPRAQIGMSHCEFKAAKPQNSGFMLQFWIDLVRRGCTSRVEP